MKSSEVKISGHYTAKVTDKLTVVRIDAEHPSGGWQATNVATGKKIRIKSAQRLKGRASTPQNATGAADAGKATDGATSGGGADTAQQGEAGGKAKGRTKKRLTKKERDAARGQHKADQENARLRDEREASDDGMTASERAMAESEPAKPEGKPKRASGRKRTGPSLIEAAIQVLGESGEPMTCSQMIDKIFEQNLWSTTGKTPAQTLYSAILREVKNKGNDPRNPSRFIHVERGKFDLNPNQKEA